MFFWYSADLCCKFSVGILIFFTVVSLLLVLLCGLESSVLFQMDFAISSLLKCLFFFLRCTKLQYRSTASANIVSSTFWCEEVIWIFRKLYGGGQTIKREARSRCHLVKAAKLDLTDKTGRSQKCRAVPHLLVVPTVCN